MSDNKELLPCPFCGTTEFSTILDYGKESARFKHLMNVNIKCPLNSMFFNLNQWQTRHTQQQAKG